MFKTRPRIRIRKRRGGDGGQLRRFLRWRSLRLRQRGHRSDARGGWVPSKLKHVPNRSSLCPGVRTPRPIRILVSLVPPVVVRIGINDDAGGAVLLRYKRLDSTKILA